METELPLEVVGEGEVIGVLLEHAGCHHSTEMHRDTRPLTLCIMCGLGFPEACVPSAPLLPPSGPKRVEGWQEVELVSSFQFGVSR